ncbi:MAG: hypothetical protein ACN6O3_12665 [Comamonas sp.]
MTDHRSHDDSHHNHPAAGPVSPEAQDVLARIQAQRERLRARQAAQRQAAALQHAHPVARDTSYGPLVERAVAFGRQHPVACAAALGLSLVLGPRRLIRFAAFALPLAMKLRK